MANLFGQVEVRLFCPEDAPGVCSLYNLHGFGPAASGYPLQPEDFLRGLREKGVVFFLVAVHKESQIVATMSFHPVSGQKAAPAGAIWGGSFFIHPEFRVSLIPLHIYLKGLEFCIEAGYYRLDTEVSPTNWNALSLFKRGGFNRTSRSIIDADDYLELVNYIPYLVCYLQRALNLDDVATRQLLQNWKYLLPLSTTRTLERDSVFLYGAEAVKYEMNMKEKGNLTCYIDLTIEMVTTITSNIFDFEFYPSNSVRQGAPGTEITFFCRYVNNSRSIFRVFLACRTGGKEAGNLLTGKTFVPGESWQGELAITLPEYPGLLTIENDLFLEEILPGETKKFHFPFATWLEVKKMGKNSHFTGEGNDFSSTHAYPALVKGGSVDYNVGRAKKVNYAGGGGYSQVRAFSLEDSWVLENLWVSVRIDQCTGCLELVEKTSGLPVIREIWPDVGPPFPGGFKRPPKRPLKLIALENGDGRAEVVLEAPANIWWCRDTHNLARFFPEGNFLQEISMSRRYVLGDGCLLTVETTIANVRTGQEASVEGTGFFLRTYPWALGRQLTLTVPTRSGLVQAAVVYEGFPFLVHDYEYVPAADLPLDPGEYTAPWSAFTEGHRLAGLIWPGATEARFGLHWMPSLLYAFPPLAPGSTHTFAPCYFYCGPGDYYTLASCWEALVERRETHLHRRKNIFHSFFCLPGGQLPVLLEVQPAAVLKGQEGNLRGRLVTVGARERPGCLTLTFPPEIKAEAAGEEKPEQMASLGEGRGFWDTLWGRRQEDAFFQQKEKASKSLFLNREFKIKNETPGEFNFSLGKLTGEPGMYPAVITWEEQGGEQRWSVPIFILGHQEGQVTVRQQRKIWQTNNQFLSYTLAPDFDGCLVQLQANGHFWLHTYFPKRHRLGRCPVSTGGAKFYPVENSRDWLENLSAEEVPWKYRARPADLPEESGLRWKGVIMEGGEARERWEGLSLQINFLTLPGSPVLLAKAEYRNESARGIEFDSVFTLYATPFPGQYFYYCRENEPFTLPVGPHKMVTVSTNFGAVLAKEGGLALVTLPGGEVRGWHDEGIWQMVALEHLFIPPGGTGAATVYLAVTRNRAEAWRYRELAGLNPFPEQS